MFEKKAVVIGFIIGILLLLGLVFWHGTAPKTPDMEITEQPQATVAPTIATFAFDPNNPAQADVSAILPDGTLASDDIIIVQSSNVSIETNSNIEFTEVPDGVKIPQFYNKLLIPDISAPLFAYTDKTGVVCVRAYGFSWKQINNVKQEKIEGFYPVQLIEKDGKIVIASNEYNGISEDKDDMAAVYNRNSTKESTLAEPYTEVSMNLYSCYDNNAVKMYRTFANVNGNGDWYPCEKNGKIENGALSVATETEKNNLMAAVPETDSKEGTYSYPTMLNGLLVTVSK